MVNEEQPASPSTTTDSTENIMYKNFPLIVPDTFTGSNISVEKFFESVEAAISVNKWTQKNFVLFARKFLKGEALAFFDLLKETEASLTFETFKSKFSEQFKDAAKIARLHIELQNTKFDLSTSFSEYVFKIKTICAKIDKSMSEQQIIFHVMKGLPLSVKTVFSMLPHSTMDELNKSVEQYAQRQVDLSLEVECGATSTTSVPPTTTQPSKSEAELKLESLVSQLSIQEKKIAELESKHKSKNHNKNSQKNFNKNKSHSSNENNNYHKKNHNGNNYKKNNQNYQKPSYYFPFNPYAPPLIPPPNYAPVFTEPPTNQQFSICASNHPTTACNLRYCLHCNKKGHTVSTCYALRNNDKNFQ